MKDIQKFLFLEKCCFNFSNCSIKKQLQRNNSPNFGVNTELKTPR